jgi:hypothetical protein
MKGMNKHGDVAPIVQYEKTFEDVFIMYTDKSSD